MGRTRLVWNPLQLDDVGAKVSCVVMTHNGWTHLVGSQQQICGDFQLSDGMAALHDWMLVSVHDHVGTLASTPTSRVVSITDPTAGDFFRFSEVCSGLGGISSGAIRCGLAPCVAMDSSPLACSLLRLNQHPCVIEGDVNDLADVGHFHAAHAAARCGLLSGFPCQPFSTLGRQAAFLDSRAQTFFGVLNAAYLIQAVLVLLECVVGAGTHKLVQETLTSFCSARGFVWKPIVLHLNRALPCYRTRWWCLLVLSWLPDFTLSDLPVLAQFATVSSLFPRWPQWPHHEEEQLALTTEEQIAFSNPAYRTSDRQLDMQGCCPTLLHSMGNQIFPCPCGCRGPLSPHAFASQGLHGVLVESQWEDLGQRHLHPKEAALLLGLPVEYDLGVDMRAALCQLGQLASPIQAHWLLQHLQAALGTLDFADLPALHQSFAEAQLSASVGLVVFDGDRFLSALDWIETSSVMVLSPAGFGPLVDFDSGIPGLCMAAMDCYGLSLFRLTGLLDSQFLPSAFVDSLFSMWPDQAIAQLRELPADLEYFGFLLCRAHWVAFCLFVSDQAVVICDFDGLPSDHSAPLRTLGHLFQVAWGMSTLTLRSECLIPQTGGSHCGSIALLVLSQLLGLMHPCDEQFAIDFHLQLCAPGDAVGYGPSSDDAVVAWLENFLPSKGVSVELAGDRARQAIQKLGLTRVQHAIQQPDPWRALKSAGNQLGKPFQWVTYEELRDHIAARETHKFRSQKADKPRPKNKRSSPSLALSPDTLTLYPTTFVDDHDEPVLPIAFSDVVANGEGVCAVTLEQAGQLLQSDVSLSPGPLAVVTIGEISHPQKNFSSLLWPALYTPTMEPVLVKGCLMNLGDVAVSMAKVEDAPAVTMLSTEVIRLTVFKHMFDKDWATMQKGPVKHLVILLSVLQPCKVDDCPGNCRNFHPACDEEVKNPVLDVWAWRWSTLDNKIVPMTQAAQFSVFLRIPASALTDVLSLSGWHGIFVEPRPASKQGPHSGFAVIWLNRSVTIDDAMALKRKHEVIVGLARMLSLDCAA
eukprot:Skav202093  [mRNA]  locus=scaffold513:202914:206070:- [translate_table: standard]